ncbi:hypothetical protein KY289_008967 [Solanum tuberosum]|nr:hypothetical protein KY289_008967 [Solanum tuberosum]
MEVVLAIGDAFLSSAFDVLIDRLAPQSDLLKMFRTHKNDVELLKKLKLTFLGLQAVLSDAENKQASNQFVREWLNELRVAVDSAENLIEQVNYEALKLKVEDASGGNLTVVPIVGMGGAGKTTLAKVVYNDENVKDHFGLKAWYCVSEPYDALRITKGLLQEIGSFDSKNDGNFNQLQVKLKEGLKGKKFLVILEDVWNDDYSEWDNLRNVFVQGDVGSKIIVTTRKESVAKMMCADHCAITVGTLSKDDSWALFKRHALENREHSELEEVGKKIADKCKGLPLALKALAGVLCG